MYASEIRDIYHAKSLLNIPAGRNRPRVLALSMCSEFPCPLLNIFASKFHHFLSPQLLRLFSIITKMFPLCLSGKCIFILLWAKYYFSLRTSPMEKKKKKTKTSPTNHLRLRGSSHDCSEIVEGDYRINMDELKFVTAMQKWIEIS